MKKDENRICTREDCTTLFIVKPHNPKRFCSSRCSVLVSNAGRVLSKTTKDKITQSMVGKRSPFKGMLLVPYVEKVCTNEWCKQVFSSQWYKKRRFCSALCAAKRPTSPKASRGKWGIRDDINPYTNFHSTWEANIARMYNFHSIEWKYESKTFDIGNQRYTPDFYLPKYDEYVEVKNFWSAFSKERDKKFRACFPTILLSTIGKEQYTVLKKFYSVLIPHWEK